MVRTHISASRGTLTDNGVKTGSEVFRPRARIIRTLGRELISNEFIAIQELVKNAYDADAKTVLLEFAGTFGADGGGSLTVLDDGTGMTLDVLRSSWMEPATVSKLTNRRSGQGRAVTGEKGIGRFAAARIAKTLCLESVSQTNDRRIVARFEWGRFDDPERYLDELTCEWTEQPADEDAAGTLLRLEGLNDNWASSERRVHGASFRRLKGELARDSVSARH